MLTSIPDAIAALRRGLPAVVVDDEARENEGDLVLPAERASEALLAFMIRYTSGVICAAITAERCQTLQLPPMVGRNEDPKGTAYTVSIDLRNRNATGISAQDRAAALRALATPTAVAGDFTRPGHLFPLRAREGGVIVRAGHTEATVDLARLAGFQPAGALAELVHDDGRMMRTEALARFARDHGLPFISIEALIRYRLSQEQLLAPAPHSDRHFFLHGTEVEVAVRGPVASVKVRPTADLLEQHPPERVTEILAALAAEAARRCGCARHVWAQEPPRTHGNLTTLGGLLEAG